MAKDEKFSELTRARVLLIDDDEIITELISCMLSESVASLEIKRTFREGLLAVRKATHDIVLIDIILPDGNGFDLVRQIQSEKIPIGIVIITGMVDNDTVRKTEATAIIVMSDKQTADIEMSIRQHSPAYFFIKPFPVDNLYAVVLRIIETREKEDLLGKNSITLFFHHGKDAACSDSATMRKITEKKSGLSTETYVQKDG